MEDKFFAKKNIIWKHRSGIFGLGVMNTAKEGENEAVFTKQIPKNDKTVAHWSEYFTRYFVDIIYSRSGHSQLVLII